MEGRQDDKGSSFEFNGIHNSLEQLPVVQSRRMHLSFVIHLLG
jgi:hypothetical protein